jgi:hypothetical protein
MAPITPQQINDMQIHTYKKTVQERKGSNIINKPRNEPFHQRVSKDKELNLLI